tara:strand:+ start:1252 stop:1416 length:165 start_codon:yes stop_codon:yes gene_type:complete
MIIFFFFMVLYLNATKRLLKWIKKCAIYQLFAADGQPTWKACHPKTSHKMKPNH